MYEPASAAVRTLAGVLLFDHISLRLMNNGIEDLREQQSQLEREGQKVLKGTRSCS